MNAEVTINGFVYTLKNIKLPVSSWDKQLPDGCTITYASGATIKHEGDYAIINLLEHGLFATRWVNLESPMSNK